MQPQQTTGAVDYRVLTTSDAAPFFGMTYRTYLPLLSYLADDSAGFAVGAFVENVPAGLILADRKPLPDATQIVSIFVAQPMRRQGIAGGLVARMEQELAECGVTEAFAVFPSGKDSTPHLERIFAEQGWSEPQPRMYLFQASEKSMDQLMTAPFMRPTELPPDYVFFPWGEHTPNDRQIVIAGLEAGRFPAMLSPYAEPAIVDPVVSLGLRYRGEIYGWMICHRIAPQTVRYTALYVRDDIPHKGLGIRMFTEAIKRHLNPARETTETIGCWGVLANNPFAAFLQRRLLPVLPDVSVSLTRETRKVLTSGAE